MTAMSCQVDWKRVLLICTFHLCSYTAATVVHVHLEAPRFVKLRDTATLVCNHSVAESDLHKIEFIRNGNKIFQFIKDRNPPVIEHRVPGAEVELTTKMNIIKLNDVRFEVSGEFSCDISTLTPIYTKGSNSVVMQVIVPQSEDPLITFKKSLYDVGDILEANCSSSPAHPAPHLTWFINGKEVDITLITTYPKRPHGNQLASTVAQLRIKVSALHAGDNGKLEISCHSTIPTYPVHHRQYADFRSKTALGCGLIDCGTDALCKGTSLLKRCQCPKDYTGDPLVKCNRVECQSNNECPTNRTCFQYMCIDPCTSNCGQNGQCITVNHIPDCSCPARYTGNPYVECHMI